MGKKKSNFLTGFGVMMAGALTFIMWPFVTFFASLAASVTMFTAMIGAFFAAIFGGCWGLGLGINKTREVVETRIAKRKDNEEQAEARQHVKEWEESTGKKFDYNKTYSENVCGS